MTKRYRKFPVGPADHLDQESDTGCNGCNNGWTVRVSQCFSPRQAQIVRDVKIFKLYTLFSSAASLMSDL